MLGVVLRERTERGVYRASARHITVTLGKSPRFLCADIGWAPGASLSFAPSGALVVFPSATHG